MFWIPILNDATYSLYAPKSNQARHIRARPTHMQSRTVTLPFHHARPWNAGHKLGCTITISQTISLDSAPTHHFGQQRIRFLPITSTVILPLTAGSCISLLHHTSQSRYQDKQNANMFSSSKQHNSSDWQRTMVRRHWGIHGTY